MPFKVGAAKERINRLVWSFNGQKLVLHYNAGEKYAAAQEKFDEDGSSRNGDDDFSVPNVRKRAAEMLCMVIEDWDAVDDSEQPIPLEPKALANLGLPMEFYSGLSNAITDDFNSRSGGNKSSS